MTHKPILFGDFMEDDSTQSNERLYKPITDRDKLISVLEEFYMKQQLGNSQVEVCARTT